MQSFQPVLMPRKLVSGSKSMGGYDASIIVKKASKAKEQGKHEIAK